MMPNELADDAVGLWQIIPAGREDFGLDGAELVDFVRRHIHALLKKGALPVKGIKEGDKYWTVQYQYGANSEEIVSNIIAEWLASGQDPDVDGIWFALSDD